MSQEYYAKHGINQTFWINIVRPAVFKKYKCCFKCGSEKDLEVHHTDYINQNINTLRAICNDCHQGIHPHYNSTTKDKMWTKKSILSRFLNVIRMENKIQ